MRVLLLCYRYLGPVPHDTSYYAKCMLGGALACGFTHAGITPLDVTKCNMQVRVLDPYPLFLALFLRILRSESFPFRRVHPDGRDFGAGWIASRG